jgi:hypothetical protein
VVRAGAAYTALWIAVIGGWCAFGYGAGHRSGRALAEFSLTHRITGAARRPVVGVLVGRQPR